MKGARLLGVAAAAIVAAFLAVSGSAGNRTGEFTFDAFPGPGRVTYDEIIAYKATFTNVGNSTFTQAAFRMRIPYAQVGSPPYAQASFVSSTCPTTPVVVQAPAGPEWVCGFGKLTPGQAGTPQLKLTVLWRAPTLASPDDCPGCLKTNGRWTIKEGVNDTADPNDAFPPGGKNVDATILSSGPGSTETLLAGGYETQAVATCDAHTSPGNLRTNPLISLTNPVSTKFCLPAFTLPTGSQDLGYVTTITETSGNARRSEVCIAALGTTCGAGYVDANFSPKLVTHVFQVAAGALPAHYAITQVFHNGVLLTGATCAATGDCVVSISFDSATGIWTIVATSPTNGLWDW
jgi:hypothetical protein